MSEQHGSFRHLSNSSYPISEDESHKEAIVIPAPLYKNNDDSSSISLEKMQDDKHQNQAIFNFIEYHLANQDGEVSENSGFNKSKKKFQLRSNSLNCEKNSSHEFFRREALRNKKKITEFLKFFIYQVAHCKILRTFKDYYPKVLIFLKVFLRI